MVLSLCSAALLWGQSQDAATPSPYPLAQEQITVTVRVTDRQGRPVNGLDCNAFRIIAQDAGTAPASLLCAPVKDTASFGFALDASRSVRDIIRHESETGLALLSNKDAGTRWNVVWFGDAAQQKTGWTQDLRIVQKAFQNPPPASQRTALFDGVRALLDSWADAPRDEQRFAIIISDGLENASRNSAASVLRHAQTLGVTCYVIHLPFYTPRDGHLVARAPAEGVRELAEQTGGRYFRLGTAQDALNPRAEYDLRPIFQALTAAREGRYQISFTLPHQKGATEKRWRVSLSRQAKERRISILRTTSALITQPEN